MSQGVILLVEDEPDVRSVVGDLLAAAGFCVATAGDYQEAINYLKTARPAVLVADIVLTGGGDGLELSATAATLGVPALLISGHPDHIHAQARGFAKFLAKPFGAAELAASVRELLAHSRNAAGK